MGTFSSILDICIGSAFEASLDFSLLTGVPSCNNYSDLQLLISRSRLVSSTVDETRSRLTRFRDSTNLLLRAGMPDCGSLMPRPGLLRLREVRHLIYTTFLRTGYQGAPDCGIISQVGRLRVRESFVKIS